MSTEEKWYSLLKEWESSGLTQEEFCKAKGVSISRFSHWRTKGIESGLFKPARVFKKETAKPLFSSIDLSSLNSEKASKSMLELHLPHGIILKIPTHPC